jgi:lipoprotein-releasing system permease protein
VRRGDDVTGVIMKGIEPKDEARVTKLGTYLAAGSLNLGRDGIVIGSELARRLKAGIGDGLSVVSPAYVEGRTFKVRGIFTSGMYEYDSNLVYVSILSAQDLLAVKGLVSGIEVKVDDAFGVNDVKRSLQMRLGPAYVVRTWMELNRTFLAALKLEKTVMFVILTLIVLVACFNIASALIMTVLEKTKDIGVLKTIGATNLNVMAIFALQGGMIGVLGTALGAAAGSVLCFLLKAYRFITLPKEIYYIDRLPVNLQIQDVTLIVASSLTITLLATLYPSFQAGRLDPIEALRYE